MEEEGYTFNQLDNNIYYTKNEETEGFKISFSWLEYGDKFVTQGLSAEKRFNVIEQEIQKVLGGEITHRYTIHKNPLINYIPNGLKFSNEEDKNRFVSNTVIDIELFGVFVKTFFTNTVLDFFNQYKTLDQVYQSYSKLERENISSFIINTGTDIFYRELVIKNKSKASDENNFVQMVINELEPMKSNPTFGKILENFKILNSNLHHTA